MGSLLGLGRRVSLGLSMSFRVGGRSVVEFGVGVRDRPVVWVHCKAVVPGWWAWRGRGEMLLAGGVLLGHDDVVGVEMRRRGRW